MRAALHVRASSRSARVRPQGPMKVPGVSVVRAARLCASFFFVPWNVPSPYELRTFVDAGERRANPSIERRHAPMNRVQSVLRQRFAWFRIRCFYTGQGAKRGRELACAIEIADLDR